MNYESPVIRVVGIGGAGCNAVEHMIREGVVGVQYLCVDADVKMLMQSSANVKLQIANKLGSGEELDAPIETAIAERDHIADVLRGAHMLFLVVGMGGTTGTGAARVVAEVAEYLGILTVAVVTKPFELEVWRKQIAEEGVDELLLHVDSLIEIPNEKLRSMRGEQFSMQEAFRYADAVIKNAVCSITDIINVPGLVGVDFADVRSVMEKAGRTMVGFGTATGVDRVRLAVERALKCPLLEDVNHSAAHGLLVNISTDCLQAVEYYYVIKELEEGLPGYEFIRMLIVGTPQNEKMGESLSVSIFATGLGG